MESFAAMTSPCLSAWAVLEMTSFLISWASACFWNWASCCSAISLSVWVFMSSGGAWMYETRRFCASTWYFSNSLRAVFRASS
ncbi:MAG: hypothetical protein A4E30_01109 [Methanomassiliicoccales archaeon PtaB.Bin215]|nr:MAG: hypothetical protein A4E30_01109 [Methanomassiliicoccales archaeon PtaB.Bin215]